MSVKQKFNVFEKKIAWSWLLTYISIQVEEKELVKLAKKLKKEKVTVIKLGHEVFFWHL